jgi:hypothetical protein
MNLLCDVWLNHWNLHTFSVSSSQLVGVRDVTHRLSPPFVDLTSLPEEANLLQLWKNMPPLADYVAYFRLLSCGLALAPRVMQIPLASPPKVSLSWRRPGPSLSQSKPDLKLRHPTEDTSLRMMLPGTGC